MKNLFILIVVVGGLYYCWDSGIFTSEKDKESTTSFAEILIPQNTMKYTVYIRAQKQNPQILTCPSVSQKTKNELQRVWKKTDKMIAVLRKNNIDFERRSNFFS